MASDEIVWNIINGNGGFCSYRLKTPHVKAQNAFCRNEYNHSGLCNRQSCPLANSRYATIREEGGKLYACIKTIERQHLPNKLWEKRLLSRSYNEALKQLDELLIYWPKYMIHRCKQRLTRLTQVQIRMRRIAAEDERLGEKLVPKMAPKIKHRERARERKAEAAAKLERTIERELVERLRQGAYGDQPLNVSEHIWKKVLNAMERDGAGERDTDMDKGLDENGEEIESSDDEEEDNLEKEVEYVSDIGESDDELGDLEEWLGSDDDEEVEEEEDSEESESEKSGNKRKRGRAIKMKNKKPRQEEKEKLMLTNDLSW